MHEWPPEMRQPAEQTLRPGDGTALTHGRGVAELQGRKTGPGSVCFLFAPL